MQSLTTCLRRPVVWIWFVISSILTSVTVEAVEIDLSAYKPESGIVVRRDAERLLIAWPMEKGDFGRLTLDLRNGQPLIEQMGISAGMDGSVTTLLKQVAPAFFLTVGSRRVPPDHPPQWPWHVFFDKPADRPHETFLAKLDVQRVRVESHGRRALITLNDVTAGSFRGALQFVIYADCRLLHVQAVVSTAEDKRAIIYDAGLVGDKGGYKRLAWLNAEGKMQRRDVNAAAESQVIPVKHRTLVAESDGGAIAVFPPPHQFQAPRDFSNNYGNAWIGNNHLTGKDVPFGFGIHQDKASGNAYVPWFNAPPNTQQHLGVFYLLTRGNADDALRETLRFTHADRFPELAGHRTFTSHYHMAITVAAMQEIANGKPRQIPDWVKVFKEMGVNMVHLGEFHGDGHQFDAGPLRLPEMKAMFDECRRLSDDQLLVIPGEEISKYLGLNVTGKHPGHWMSLFPKPVYFALQRTPDQPLVEDHPEYGKVYRIGSLEDMQRLIAAENALVWSAHPRIKASNWTPDIFRHEDFYLADSWLGAAWKAMPGDLSEPRLGKRCLDLLDDMANWGQKKYLPGEVDVFKIDHTHELYGHMNINYMRMDKSPRYEDGWLSVLSALRGGQFFTTTGEVLLPSFTVGGKRSGETLKLTGNDQPELRVELDWTFPLRFAEVISGDGERVHRELIDLTETAAFGKKTITLRPNLRGRRWVRFEVWDIAANGAYTQPVWLE